MKKCDFCIHCGCTDKNELVCSKRLLYVEEVDKNYPCSDFAINFPGTLRVALVGLAICLAVIILLGILFN